MTKIIPFSFTPIAIAPKYIFNCDDAGDHDNNDDDEEDDYDDKEEYYDDDDNEVDDYDDDRLKIVKTCEENTRHPELNH